MTAADLGEFGLVDAIVREPPGGAHTDREATVAGVREVLVEQLDDLGRLGTRELVAGRRERLRSYGHVTEFQLRAVGGQRAQGDG